MEQSPFIRLAGIAIIVLSIVIGIWILFGPAVPADWTICSHGTTSRLAILLTEPDSSWLGLVHDLKSNGTPFNITRDVHSRRSGTM